MEIEKRFNETTYRWEEKRELWLDEYLRFVLEDELNARIQQLQFIRNKVGISPDDVDSPNKHIEALKNTLILLGLKIYQ